MSKSFFDDIEGEFELDPEELAWLFAVKWWMYATPRYGYGVPNAEAIRRVLLDLAKEVLNDSRGGVVATRGRFLAHQHENSDGVDIYLNIGVVWPQGMRDDEFGERL